MKNFTVWNAEDGLADGKKYKHRPETVARCDRLSEMWS